MNKKNLLFLFCFVAQTNLIKTIDPVTPLVWALGTGLVTGLTTSRYLNKIDWNEPLISSNGMGYAIGTIFGGMTGLCLIKKYFSDKKKEKLRYQELNKLINVQVIV